jgi:ribulose-5-phosphate 4-epimerase/fuculose-1-phosphate aldolase
VSAQAVAGIARLLARADLVEAFGHVSARSADGFLLTPTVPALMEVGAADVLELDAEGSVRSGDPGACPLEAPLHAAVYAARPDVGAICRTHSRHAAAWAARGVAPPLVHGLGLLCGEIAVHDDSDLVADETAGRSAAVALGASDCLLLRANGALATAPVIGVAAVRAHYLEERARIADLAPGAAVLAGDRRAARERHTAAETLRAWRWLAGRHGDADLTAAMNSVPIGNTGAWGSADNRPNEERDHT